MSGGGLVGRARSVRDHLQVWLARHPQVLAAVKSALAAGIAWYAVLQMGGWLNDYPYYAPLGAVVAVTNTLAQSAREAAQATLAILLGVGIASLARLGDLPVLPSLVLVVALGTLLAPVRALGAMGSWVPISGLFALLVGNADPVHYSLAYFGLTGFGAAVGVAVNLVFPPLPLLRTERTEARLRELLAEQLDSLADGLLCDEELTHEDWLRRRHDLLPGIYRLEEVLSELSDARRGNWRVRRWRQMADHQHQQARALHQLSLLVEEVTSLVVARGHLLRTGLDEGTSLLGPAGRALQATAELLRSVDGPTADLAELEATDAAVEELARAIRENDAGSRDDGFAAASIVTSIRRAVESLTPEDAATRLPTHW